MFPDIKNVRHLKDYQLELIFADGVKGIIDFTEWIVGKGGVFAPLANNDFFSRVAINPEIGTIVWPNGVDFDPEVLYSKITGKPIEKVLPPSARRAAV